MGKNKKIKKEIDDNNKIIEEDSFVEEDAVEEKNKKDKKENVESIEELTKTNKIYKIIIVILLIIILLIGGVFLAGYFNNDEKDDSKKEVNENKKHEIPTLTIDSDIVKNLFLIFDEISYDNYDVNTHINDGNYDINKSRDYNNIDVRKSIVWDSLEFDKKIKKKTCGSLEIGHIENDYFCSGYLQVDLPYDKNGNIDFELLEKNGKNKETSVIDAEDFKNKYLELFGKDSKFEAKSFFLNSFPCGYAYYDKTNNLYAVFNCIGGSEAVDAVQSLDKIEQKEKSLKLFTTLTIEKDYVLEIVYEFTFEEDTGNYIFVNRSEKEITVDDNEESKKDETENLEKLTKDSEVVKDLFNMFKIEDCDEYSFIKKVNTDMGVKKYFIYRSLAENEFVEKTCGSLNANRYGDGLFCAESNYYGSNWTKYDNDVKNKKVRTFDAKLFKEKYLKLYGSNASYKDENFDLLRGPIAYYDSKNNLYAIFNCWCGGACGNGYEHVIDDIEQDGYNLTINTKLTTYSGDAVDSVEDVKYLFKYESSTGNYVFVKTA